METDLVFVAPEVSRILLQPREAAKDLLGIFNPSGQGPFWFKPSFSAFRPGQEATIFSEGEENEFAIPSSYIKKSCLLKIFLSLTFVASSAIWHVDTYGLCMLFTFPFVLSGKTAGRRKLLYPIQTQGLIWS